jgi:hypothetical protein
MKKCGKRFLLWCAAILVLSLLALAACSSTIHAPVDPVDPVQVYLLIDAKHVGVVLPQEAGNFVEYGFGDWDWYALCCDRWYHVFDTVLWPTQGCLGRAWLGRDQLDRDVAQGKLTPIPVGRAEMANLLNALEQRFSEEISTMIHNPAYNMYFVEDDRGFWFLHNCHDAVADWMEQLGCEVSWAFIRLDIEVAEP